MTRGHSRVSGDLHLSKASGGGSQIGRLRSCGEKIITVIMLLIRVAAMLMRVNKITMMTGDQGAGARGIVQGCPRRPGDTFYIF